MASDTPKNMSIHHVSFFVQSFFVHGRTEFTRKMTQSVIEFLTVWMTFPLRDVTASPQHSHSNLPSVRGLPLIFFCVNAFIFFLHTRSRGWKFVGLNCWAVDKLKSLWGSKVSNKEYDFSCSSLMQSTKSFNSTGEDPGSASSSSFSFLKTSKWSGTS